MIIVEGPDGSGKSTLAQYLRVHVKAQSVVAWNDPPKSAEQLALNLKRSKDLARKGDAVVIQDRTPWVTEPIYEVLKYGVDRLPKWHYYQAGLTLLRSTLIYCRPPNKVIRKHATTGTSPPDTAEYLEWIGEHIDDIIGLYDAFLGPVRPIVYDWTKPDPDLVPNMLEMIEKKKVLASVRANSKALKSAKSKAGAPRPQSTPKSELGDSRPPSK